MAAKGPRLTCLVCERAIAVRRDRTLTQHGGSRAASCNDHCAGSALPSLEDSARILAELLATAPRTVIDVRVAELRNALGEKPYGRLYAAADALIH